MNNVISKKILFLTFLTVKLFTFKIYATSIFINNEEIQLQGVRAIKFEYSPPPYVNNIAFNIKENRIIVGSLYTDAHHNKELKFFDIINDKKIYT